MRRILLFIITLTVLLTAAACTADASISSIGDVTEGLSVQADAERPAPVMPDVANPGSLAQPTPAEQSAAPNQQQPADQPDQSLPAAADDIYAQLGVVSDMRPSFQHGSKPAEYQRYIVLHDTEGWGDPASVISSWDGAGRGVAAHFIVGTDGSVMQAVPLDTIAHHAGFGDPGKNDMYGTPEDGRDDMVGTTSIGGGYPCYGMNAYSVGIELVHVGGSGGYPEEQLAALDGLIAYIDAYYGFASQIIDHKSWCSTNSDCSAEFQGYLANYQAFRKHV